MILFVQQYTVFVIINFFKLLFRYCGKNECEKWYEFNGIHGANSCTKPTGELLSKWLVVVNVMLDVGVSQLPHLGLHGTMENEFNHFVSTLRRCNARLKELSVHFQVRYSCLLHLFKH